MQIGRLEEVDIRELWAHEQYDFSDWLAKPDNLQLLNEELGLALVDAQKEVFVGSYRCDLVCSDETSDDVSIIENQLESSNHEHLGKIITYASGLKAKNIIWIVKAAKEEHRSAIEWLNNNTPEDIAFFLLEIHAYKIGDSIPAAKFLIIESPNGFIKGSKANVSKSGELNKSQSERVEFWTRFQEALKESKAFNPRKVNSDHWCNLPIGNSKCHLSVTLINSEGYIGVEFYIPNNKELFYELYEHRDEIDAAAGDVELIWQPLEGKKAARVLTKIPGLNFDDKSNYDELINKAIERAVLLRSVFKAYI